VTDLARTALDLAGCAPRDEAVALVDRFLRSVPLGHDELLAAAVADRARGARRAEAVIRLADGLAESPMETVVRLLLHRSRLPPPVAQFRVRHGGQEIARVDFAWPDRRVAVEYDGRWHGEPGQFTRDRARLNRLTAAGWRVVFVTAEGLRNPTALVARVAAELDRSM
jgi:very-short-patch-repair endonuclease